MSLRKDGTELTYHRAESLGDARAQLRRRGACVYAGGTDLVVALRAGAPWVAGVRHLVDIKSLDALRGVSMLNGLLRIGALVTARELAASAMVRRHTPVLGEAAAQSSAPGVRARGTMGGNLMTPHAAGDVATALMALGGTAQFITTTGRRLAVTVEALVAGVKKVPHGALLLGVSVPSAQVSAYERFGRRLAFCRATLSVAVVQRADEQRIAVAGVGDRPALVQVNELAPGDTADVLHGLVRRAGERARLRSARRKTRL